MKALILNSGLGSRMGDLTKEHPKCMTEIGNGETIVSRQLKMLSEAGIREIVMTTGVFADILREYCDGLGLPVQITYVLNPAARRIIFTRFTAPGNIWRMIFSSCTGISCLKRAFWTICLCLRFPA